jgi:hypothetical protein
VSLLKYFSHFVYTFFGALKDTTANFGHSQGDSTTVHNSATIYVQIIDLAMEEDADNVADTEWKQEDPTNNATKLSREDWTQTM